MVSTRGHSDSKVDSGAGKLKQYGTRASNSAVTPFNTLSRSRRLSQPESAGLISTAANIVTRNTARNSPNERKPPNSSQPIRTRLNSQTGTAKILTQTQPTLHRTRQTTNQTTLTQNSTSPSMTTRNSRQTQILPPNSSMTKCSRGVVANLGTRHAARSQSRDRSPLSTSHFATHKIGTRSNSSNPSPPISTRSSSNSSARPRSPATTTSAAPKPKAAVPPPAPKIWRPSLFPLHDAHHSDANDKRHPREFIPAFVGFPHDAIRHISIAADDLDDRLLMATCSVLLDNDNKALCPKEIAEELFEREWLKNAGAIPFSHISNAIRAHVRRCELLRTPPLVIPFEMMGTLTESEIAAIGFRSRSIKRGTLWYLDERVFGKEVGANDPFAQCRIEAGLDSLQDSNRIYVRQTAGPGVDYLMQPEILINQPIDMTADLGRGKRKRRVSSAMMSSQFIGQPETFTPQSLPSATTAATLPQTEPQFSQPIGSEPIPVRSAIPRLRLRMAALEEIESSVDDSDGFTSDAARTRRENKKKICRAKSEGGQSTSSRESTPNSQVFDSHDFSESSSEEDEDETVRAQMLPPVRIRRPSAFSAASATALLEQSLRLAASPPTGSNSLEAAQTPSAISPNSLQMNKSKHFLAMSAPGRFSHFPTTTSPKELQPDEIDYFTLPNKHSAVSAVAEEILNESIHSVEDFEFEWSAETQTDETKLRAPFASSQPISRSREASLALSESAEFDLDSFSTPATTPRSPAGCEEVDTPATELAGFDLNLSAVFAGAEEPTAEEIQVAIQPKISTENCDLSTETITSANSEAITPETPTTTAQQDSDSCLLPIPLPSPLVLNMPDPLALNEFDFVGHEIPSRLNYRSRSTSNYESAETADDEGGDSQAEDSDDEAEFAVNVKLEDVEHDSTFASVEAFSRQLANSQISGQSAASPGQGYMANSPLAYDEVHVNNLGLSSPADSTDWGMSLDLEEFDPESNRAVDDHRGPEAVGLDELDLAWGATTTTPESDDGEWEIQQINKSANFECCTFLTGSLNKSQIEREDSQESIQQF